MTAAWSLQGWGVLFPGPLIYLKQHVDHENCNKINQLLQCLLIVQSAGLKPTRYGTACPPFSLLSIHLGSNEDAIVLGGFWKAATDNENVKMRPRYGLYFSDEKNNLLVAMWLITFPQAFVDNLPYSESQPPLDLHDSQTTHSIRARTWYILGASDLEEHKISKRRFGSSSSISQPPILLFSTWSGTSCPIEWSYRLSFRNQGWTIRCQSEHLSTIFRGISMYAFRFFLVSQACNDCDTRRLDHPSPPDFPRHGSLPLEYVMVLAVCPG